MIEEVIKKFNIEGKLVSIESNNSGNINKTYIATFIQEGNVQRKYLIQRINTTVFREPYKLMKNIEGVTRYLERMIRKEKDNNHEVLKIVKTTDGRLLCSILGENGSRDYYRIYQFIENSVSYDYSVDPQIVYNTGKAFGNFQRLLADYPMHKLEETIKDFHDTRKRYRKLRDRALKVAREIVFILKREDICSLIMDELGTDAVPLRVTHNDTKVNNVMMNMNTGDYLAVIDLDTVMPGSMLFDYGDGIRSTASTTAEDERDLTKVKLNLELFKMYTDGYLSEMAPFLTERELMLMGESIRIITLELAIRFLNDYINGDTYFKIDYEEHNLVRARNQLELIKDIESKLPVIESYILNSYEKYGGRILRK